MTDKPDDEFQGSQIRWENMPVTLRSSGYADELIRDPKPLTEAQRDKLMSGKPSLFERITRTGRAA